MLDRPGGMDELFMRSTSSEKATKILAAGGQVIEASPRRIAIGFVCPITNAYTVSTLSPAVLGQGLTIAPTGGIFWLTIWEAGDTVRKPWFGISNVADQTVSIFEVMADH